MSIDTAASQEPVEAHRDLEDLTVITATWLETWAARCALPRGTKVVAVGIGATGGANIGAGPVIVCGLAGALSPALQPGTIVIPTWVGLPSGERLPCEPGLVDALARAARSLGFEPELAPLLTAPALVTGATRRFWTSHGYAAVDMESALLLRRHPQGAVVRVILDAPQRELSKAWDQGWRALAAPWRWPEAFRLARDAPRAAYGAATVIRAALGAT